MLSDTFLTSSDFYFYFSYCIVRPGQLGVGPPTGVVDVIDGKAGRIQRSDLADFCLKVGSGQWTRTQGWWWWTVE